jgi:hypothetical protein
MEGKIRKRKNKDKEGEYYNSLSVYRLYDDNEGEYYNWFSSCIMIRKENIIMV